MKSTTITQKDLEKVKLNNKLKCKCFICNEDFYISKRRIQNILNSKTTDTGKFCSRKCRNDGNKTKQKVKCSNCNSDFFKKQSQIKQSKSGNHFCSKSCAAIYNNTHKTHGTKRSKLEIYLEEQLTSLYPGLEIHYNQKSAINSELDIYIPSFNLAFELNGIYHYEPIHGDKKLSQIQNNDQNKFQACIEKNISLCIIDVSSMKNFKQEKSYKFLNIITKIINL